MNNIEAESLMKRIEIKRIFNNPTEYYSLEEIIDITSMFMMLSVETKDWRFFNTSLKLIDWLNATGNCPQHISDLEDSTMQCIRLSCGLTK
jgi:hypothetical protein